MITYKAMYKFVPEGVHGEVLDFPGAITVGKDLDEARRLLGSALVDLAELLIEEGQPFPIPNSQATDAESDLEEPIHLLLNTASKIVVRPAGELATA